MAKVETMETVLRGFADAVARFIEADDVLGSYSNLTVVVEDRANVDTTIKTALAKATGGVAVLVAIAGFHRRRNSGPVLTGTIDLEISVHENPLFNRKNQFVLTAQCVAERLAILLHWAKLPDYDNRILLDDIVRADDNTANIEVVTLHSEQTLHGIYAE